jgi:hypothetical protein
MKRYLLVCRLLLVAAGLVCAGTARADVIAFSYDWSISPGAVIAGTGEATGSVAFALAADGSSSATLGGGSVSVPGATISSTSTAGGTVPPDHYSSPFSLTLRLTDTASGNFKDLTFSGNLAGDMTATSSTVKATFASLTQSASLGGHAYSATIDPGVVNIQDPTSKDLAKITALVSVSDPVVDPPPPTHNTPEPSTLLLAGLAIPLLGAAARHRRRARDRQPR